MECRKLTEVGALCNYGASPHAGVRLFSAAVVYGVTQDPINKPNKIISLPS